MSTYPRHGQIDPIARRIRAYLSREFYQASHEIEKFLGRVWRYGRQKQDVALRQEKVSQIPAWQTVRFRPGKGLRERMCNSIIRGVKNNGKRELEA